MFRFVSWWVLVLAGICTLGYAEDPGHRITLDQAVQEALQANLTLKNAGLISGTKERDKNLAFNKLLPTLSVGAGVTHFNDMYTYKQMVAYVPAPYGGPLGTDVYYTPNPTYLVLQLNAQFVLSWATLEAIRHTGIEYENSRISYQMAAQKTERDVRKAFYQLLFLQEATKVTEHQVSAAEQRYQDALTNQKAGQSAKLTVLQAKVSWENKKPGLEDLKVNYKQLLFGFEALLGRNPDPALVPVGTLDFDLPPGNLNAEEAVTRFLGRRLDIQAAQGQVRAADGYLAIQNALRFPAIGVQFTADPMLNDPWRQSQSAFFDRTNWYQKDGALTFFVTWQLDNLIPWTQFDSKVRDTSDLGAQARVGVSGTELAARAEVMTLFSKVNKSTQDLESLKNNEDSALEAFQLTDEAYKSGVRSLLEVEDSEVQYQFAQLALLNEKQALNASLLDLETALNTPRAEIFALPRTGETNHDQ